jgi:thiosulfate dehydrogenase [quinone] large subunit
MQEATVAENAPDFSKVAADRRAAHAILRLALGVNMLLHGLVRLPHMAAFVNGMATQFQATVLPGFAVKSFGWVLPFAEGLIGLLLVLGWRTRQALVAGGLVMAALIAGTSLRSDWPTVGIQMVYSAIYYLLLRDASHNGFSLDGWLGRRGG